MMGATGEPSAYYPMDSNGLAVQNAPAQPCVCPVFVPAQTAACPPLGYGGCEGGRREEVSSAVFLMVFGGCLAEETGRGHVSRISTVPHWIVFPCLPWCHGRGPCSSHFGSSCWLCVGFHSSEGLKCGLGR